MEKVGNVTPTPVNDRIIAGVGPDFFAEQLSAQREVFKSWNTFCLTARPPPKQMPVLKKVTQICQADLSTAVGL